MKSWGIGKSFKIFTLKFRPSSKIYGGKTAGIGQKSVEVTPKAATPKGVEVFDLYNDRDQTSHARREVDQSSGGGEDFEESAIRLKDLHHFKVPNLPIDAGSYRQWKNSLRALVMSYDRSTDGSLMGWITQALGAKTDQEKANLQLSSGAFPRFDRVLAAALCKPEHLRSQFGVRFNAYLETCELQHEEIRGRVMLNVISREFDTDRNTGAIVTALELYNLPPPQDNIAALRQWRDKVNYVRNQIGPQDQPEPRLLAKWLYDRLKKHPAMRRHVDKVRDAPSGSEMQTFDWLWGKLDQCIHESQQEANAISIQEAFRKGPPKKPSPSNAASGMTAKAAKGGKEGEAIQGWQGWQRQIQPQSQTQ